MKILVALHAVMDLGGIINHTENLIMGLSELGHDVHFTEFRWSTKHESGKRSKVKFDVGETGLELHQGKGWKLGRGNVFGYAGPNLKWAKDYISQFDLVIWTVPVPPKNKSHIGNNEWPELYNVRGVKQVAFVHDGNIRKGGKHLTKIDHLLDGLACVHPCALYSSNYSVAPRKLILNPQAFPMERQHPSWEAKDAGFINAQTFKGWKHVDDLVRAISYMPDPEYNETREVFGEGIEYQYMTSELKCKSNYFHDTDIDHWFAGQRIWDTALANGMEHSTYVSEERLMQKISQKRVLVDPSWSKEYAKHGGHFNRVSVEAMMHGTVPVARRMGMGTDFMVPGEHYYEIPAEATPQEYADCIMDAAHLSSNRAKQFHEAARGILPFFERKYVAQQVIDLAEGDGGSEDHDSELRVDIKEKADMMAFEHYGIPA